jgi:hypothetical protein
MLVVQDQYLSRGSVSRACCLDQTYETIFVWVFSLMIPLEERRCLQPVGLRCSDDGLSLANGLSRKMRVQVINPYQRVAKATLDV